MNWKLFVYCERDKINRHKTNWIMYLSRTIFRFRSITPQFCSVDPYPLHYSVAPSPSLRHRTWVLISQTIKLPSLIESLTVLCDIITYRLPSTTIILIKIWHFILSTCPMRYQVFPLGQHVLLKCCNDATYNVYSTIILGSWKFEKCFLIFAPRILFLISSEKKIGNTIIHLSNWRIRSSNSSQLLWCHE